MNSRLIESKYAAATEASLVMDRRQLLIIENVVKKIMPFSQIFSVNPFFCLSDAARMISPTVAHSNAEHQNEPTARPTSLTML